MSDKNDITCDLKLAKRIWGRKDWRVGFIPCGTVGDYTLFWRINEWIGGINGLTIPIIEQNEIQYYWLKAVKASTDCSVDMIAGGISIRTWQNWSQGRPIPLERIMDIYLFLKNS